jgi:hypothetical protein
LPFLRFTRDKRGYETTSLVHAIRHRGRARQRILYWFRTPPSVKVGRPALDEDAIRWIEEHNPDIDFDWQKILEAQPPPPPPSEDGRNRRRRDVRDRPERPAAKDGRRRSSPEPTPQPSLNPEELESVEAVLPSDVATPDDSMIPLIEDALEQITHPDAEELPEPSLSPGESVVGGEQLTRLRARYAEMQARITERGGDAARIEELRGKAEALNPDTWVTDAEVRKGLEEFEPKIRDLRAALGLRRRRRSRRGGRRRHRGEQDGPPVAPGTEQTAATAETSNPEGPPDSEEGE